MAAVGLHKWYNVFL